MTDLRINTATIRNVSAQLKTINDRIKNKITPLNNSVNSLDKVWDGPAASAVLAKFADIKNTLEPNRYNSIDNYVRFLKAQVGEGYEQTEDVNTKLAERFK